MLDGELLPGNVHGHLGQAIDGDHLVTSDVHGTHEVRGHQAPDAFQAFVDVQERTGLLAVAPDLDLAAVGSLGDLA